MPSAESHPQNDFMNAARKERKRVEIYLVNGIRLTGCIESFDQYLVMLRTPVGLQGIYKRAISTIQLDTGTRPAPWTSCDADTTASTRVGRTQVTNAMWSRSRYGNGGTTTPSTQPSQTPAPDAQSPPPQGRGDGHGPRGDHGDCPGMGGEGQGGSPGSSGSGSGESGTTGTADTGYTLQ